MAEGTAGGSDIAAELQAFTSRSAGMSHLLELVARADRESLWVASGSTSCADWLAVVAGVHSGTARDWVAVARGLERRPVLAAAMEAGELSYSKVRALLRIDAGGRADEELVAVARKSPASALARLLA